MLTQISKINEDSKEHALHNDRWEFCDRKIHVPFVYRITKVFQQNVRHGDSAGIGRFQFNDDLFMIIILQLLYGNLEALLLPFILLSRTSPALSVVPLLAPPRTRMMRNTSGASWSSAKARRALSDS